MKSTFWPSLLNGKTHNNTHNADYYHNTEH